jgi:membrane protein DedA with SNARE-associated domain
MNEGMQLFLLFVAWMAIAAGMHFTVERYFLASFLAACAMVIVTQVASYLQIERLDPLWMISSLVGFCLALVVALVTGLPFRIVRQLRKKNLSGSDPTD